MDLNSNDKLLLSTRTIDFNVIATTKEEAFQYIAKRLFSLDMISNINKFIQDVRKREKRGNTTLTNGFAIPHGISTTVFYPVIYFVKVKNPICNWYALDQSNVQNIMMFALPIGCRDKKRLIQIKKMMLILSEDENLFYMSRITTKNLLINYLSKKLSAMEE